jgi:hypothetical protein
MFLEFICLIINNYQQNKLFNHQPQNRTMLEKMNFIYVYKYVNIYHMISMWHNNNMYVMVNLVGWFDLIEKHIGDNKATLLVCLWGYFQRWLTKEKIHPECTWHHPTDWKPRSNKVEKEESPLSQEFLLSTFWAPWYELLYSIMSSLPRWNKSSETVSQDVSFHPLNSFSQIFFTMIKNWQT